MLPQKLCLLLFPYSSWSAALSTQPKEQTVLQVATGLESLDQKQAGVLTTIATQSGDYGDVSEVVTDALVSEDSCRANMHR